MDYTQFLKPELVAVAPVLAVTLAAVFRALEESKESATSRALSCGGMT